MNSASAEGLIQAHHIVAEVAASLPEVRWWQLGRKKHHQLAILVEVSNRIYDEVTRQHDARYSGPMA